MQFDEGQAPRRDQGLLAALSDSLRAIERTADRFYSASGAEVRRVLFARLPAGQRIPPHRDSGAFLETHRRLHIPIVTDEHVRFLAGDAEHVLAAGDIWELNNQRAHGVVNDGASARIHLIVDIAVSAT